MADTAVVVAWSEVARWAGVIMATTGLSWKARAMFGKVYMGQHEAIRRVDEVDGKVDRLSDHVERQNGRVKDLEGSVMYKDTCDAMHGQNASGIERLEQQLDQVTGHILETNRLLTERYHLRNND